MLDQLTEKWSAEPDTRLPFPCVALMLRNPNGALVAIDRRINIECFFILQVQAVSDQHIAQNEARIRQQAGVICAVMSENQKGASSARQRGWKPAAAAARAQL